jgi:hypothetical protein
VAVTTPNPQFLNHLTSTHPIRQKSAILPNEPSPKTGQYSAVPESAEPTSPTPFPHSPDTQADSACAAADVLGILRSTR